MRWVVREMERVLEMGDGMEWVRRSASSTGGWRGVSRGVRGERRGERGGRRGGRKGEEREERGGEGKEEGGREGADPIFIIQPFLRRQ